MSDEQYDHLVKILLIGESGVGKTCILQRFNRDEFLVNHLATIAIDFKMKIFDVDNSRLKMQIWDTAGQERYNTLTSGFFKAAHGIMVCYSVTDERSFQSINKWIAQIKNLAPNDVKILLVGNKSDLKNDRVVSTDAGKECAEKYGIEFVETSAFNGENVVYAFESLGRMILTDIKKEEQEGDHLNRPKKKNKCC